VILQKIGRNSAENQLDAREQGKSVSVDLSKIRILLPLVSN
jgi:hypothetical protein